MNISTGMADTEKELLARLAEAHGIERSYWDIWGNLHEIPDETIREMLVAMGVDAAFPEKALVDLEHRVWNRLVEPVLVESIDPLPSELFFQIPTQGDSVGEQLVHNLLISLKIVGESGTAATRTYGPEQVVFKETKQIEGVTYSRWSVPFPEGLSVGYYQFTLSMTHEGETHEDVISVVLCPTHSYLPPSLHETGKRAGIFISLYGLRSQRNWGVGDFGDLKEFVRWAIGTLHVDVIGLNPLHAISNRQPYNISPYFPSSRLYRNPIYLDIEALDDYQLCPEAQDLVQAEATQNLLVELRSCELVQYERVAALKLQVLQVVFQDFLRRHWRGRREKTDRRRQFETYIEQEGTMLDKFATFCALEDFFHKENPDIWIWRQWPAPYQDPHSGEVQSFRQNHWKTILFHKYLQWQLESQLVETQELAKTMGASIGLYHDLALGIDPNGADFWSYRDFFVEGVTVGAPPDDFALEGQDWGFHPPNRERCRNDGYRLFIDEIRKNCRGSGALRIDHIMRFFRLFWISAGKPPAEGTYVDDFHQDLIKILALESSRAKTLIIGEDLGTVPPMIREILQQFGIFSYRLFYFERDEQGNFKEPHCYPSSALAAVTTHDLPTLAGFWTAQDIVLRNRLGMFPDETQFHAALQKRKEEKERILHRLVSSGFLAEETISRLDMHSEATGELYDAIMGFLTTTPAKLVIFSQEDLFMDTRQQNLPGTVAEYPNWSVKMSYSLEELRQDPRIEDYSRKFRSWVDHSGRGVLASS